MNLIEKILKDNNLKYEKLSTEERDTLHIMVESAHKSQLTVDKIAEYITSMREKIELELCDMKHDSKNDIYLKARLQNYLLLEAVLEAPKKAEKLLQESLSRLK